ncbi:hypothetical protein PR048_009567 [Dryococelus australis]|uniref:Uncharacterized protein n=1 Tax=Dryococelus australis TaxID=614101 RepID=A0ABQ9I104_9NEOP|nr:hypothetical protein PR048_009567 [Dryococelus australis]
MRVKRGEERRGKREIPEKTRRPVASSGTIPTSGNGIAGNRTRDRRLARREACYERSDQQVRNLRLRVSSSEEYDCRLDYWTEGSAEQRACHLATVLGGPALSILQSLPERHQLEYHTLLSATDTCDIPAISNCKCRTQRPGEPLHKLWQDIVSDQAMASKWRGDEESDGGFMAYVGSECSRAMGAMEPAKGAVGDRSPEQPAGVPTRRSGRRVPGEAMESAIPSMLLSWLARSPPTKMIRIRYPAGSVGIVLDDAACRRVFSGNTSLPRPYILAALRPRISFHVTFRNDRAPTCPG